MSLLIFFTICEMKIPSFVLQHCRCVSPRVETPFHTPSSEGGHLEVRLWERFRCIMDMGHLPRIQYPPRKRSLLFLQCVSTQPRGKRALTRHRVYQPFDPPSLQNYTHYTMQPTTWLCSANLFDRDAGKCTWQLSRSSFHGLGHGLAV